MLGKGTSDERFQVPAKEVVERSFRSVLLASNMSSYAPKCAKETSDPYFRVTSRTRLLYHFSVDSLASPVTSHD